MPRLIDRSFRKSRRILQRLRRLRAIGPRNAMSQPDLVIRGRRVVLPGEVTAASLHIRDGHIAKVAAFDEIPTNCEMVEAGKDSIVMPGLVDTHVHVNEPGRTEWEGFATAT